MSRISLGTNWNVTETVVAEEDGDLISCDVMPGWATGAILDHNATLRSLNLNHGDIRHVGAIPTTMWTEWKKGWRKKRSMGSSVTWTEYKAARMNDRSFANLRTIDGRV